MLLLFFFLRERVSLIAVLIPMRLLVSDPPLRRCAPQPRSWLSPNPIESRPTTSLSLSQDTQHKGPPIFLTVPSDLSLPPRRQSNTNMESTQPSCRRNKRQPRSWGGLGLQAWPSLCKTAKATHIPIPISVRVLLLNDEQKLFGLFAL